MSGLYKTTIGADNVAVYQVSGTNTSRSLPDWIARRRKRSLKNDVDYANRVELIQEFGFDEAANKLKVTRDGQYCMATGTYKPQIRVYELSQAGLKFERHTDAENVDFEILSSDWTKSVHLQNDRTIEFHSQGGIHTKTRIPKFGRALAYNPNNCDIIVGATGNQVYRLNADQGRFLAPYEMDFEQGAVGTKSEGGVNCLDINPVHSLLGFGLENGTVEFWDPRSRRRVAQLNIGGAGHGVGSGVTALSFRNDGLNVGFGTYEGNTLLFDMRASEPYVQKDQGYDLPIKKIGWIESDGIGSSGSKVFSADRKIVKIWDRVDGKPYTAMEPVVDINDVAYIEDTGMFLMANEGKHMHAYYIPSIGPAPNWCSYLENVTEELESSTSQAAVYENFRFIEKDMLKSLNLDQYIGTNVVRSYMHGYFIHQDLYDQARSIANPHAYQEHRDREIRKRIEKERESRIRSAIKTPKVKANKALAAQLRDEKEGAGEEEEANIATDDRFKVLFEDPDYEVDETSKEYKASGLAASGGKSKNTVSKTGEARERMRGLTAAELSDEERFSQQSRKQKSANPFDSDDEHMEESSSDEEPAPKVKKAKAKAALPEMRAVDMYKSSSKRRNGDEAGADDDEADNVAFEDMYEETKREERDRAHIRENVHRTRVGEVEYTFVPEKKEPKPRQRKDAVEGEEGNDESTNDRGRTKQRFDGRRRASKNAFRGM